MAELAAQIPLASKRPACAAVGTNSRATLLDLLDRVLGKGVVAYGDIVLSIADIDLVYLNLRAVLSAIGTLENKETGGGKREARYGPQFQPPVSRLPPPAYMPPVFSGGAPELEEEARGEKREAGYGPQFPPPASRLPPPNKLELDPRKLEQGLAKLVLTLINLLRRLMERQAIRRMEAGTLTPEQLERAGQAFKRLDERLKELTEQFGLKEEDLNLDLGPLGELV